MGIFTNNPVLKREVRGRLRLNRRGSVTANLWIARLLGLVVAYYYAKGMLGIWRSTVQDARELWPLLVYGALVLIVLLSPALAATAITQEREQQTWEILATTRLSASEVLLGKWLGRQMVPGLLLVILLPYLVMCVIRGQLGVLLLPAVLVFLIMTIGCYSAFGLLCSFLTRRTMTATASALIVSAFFCIGTLVIEQVFRSLIFLGGSSEGSLTLWANPFYSFGSMMDQLSPSALGDSNSDPGAPVWYLLFTGAATVSALVFMVRRYRHAVRERS